MALQTAAIIKNGSQLQILYYSNNGATSTSNVTITNPNGVKVWLVNTNTVNLKFENYDALSFNQVAGGSNKVDLVNDVDTSAYTGAQLRDLLNAVFFSGFNATLGYAYDKGYGLHLTTSTSGATYVAFADYVCNGVDVINSSGTALEFLLTIPDSGVSVYLPDNSSRWIGGITNANQVTIRRVDTSNTQVTITAQAIRI